MYTQLILFTAWYNYIDEPHKINHFSQRVQMSLRTHVKYSNAIKCHHKSKSQRTYHTASSGSWPLSRWGRSSTGQRDHSSITYTPNLRERHTQCLLRHRAGDNVLDRLHVHFLVVFSSSPVSLLSSIWLFFVLFIRSSCSQLAAYV